MKRSRESRPSSFQQSERHADIPQQEPELLVTAEAAAFLRFDGPNAVRNFFAWADRWNVPRLKRGRTCLWQRSVLVAFLQRKKWTKNRAQVA